MQTLLNLLVWLLILVVGKYSLDGSYRKRNGVTRMSSCYYEVCVNDSYLLPRI